MTHAYIALLVFLTYNWAETCDIDNTPEYITWEKELMKDLHCGYNPHRAPLNNTIVNITYFIDSFILFSDLQFMRFRSFVATKWKDERLIWDPKKYNGINGTDASNFKIWTPVFGLSQDEDFLDIFPRDYRYNVKSTGDVKCFHQVLEETSCSLKFTNWPYDVQECRFEFAPTKLSRQTGNFTINFELVVIEHDGSEWYMYDYKQVEDNFKKGRVNVTFSLMREGVGLSAIVISPAFVLTVLSISSLCLDVRRKVRLAIISFSLMGHYRFLVELANDLPKESLFPPTLLLYYRGSVVLSVIIILSTFLMAAICELKSTPHIYVKLINDFVYENKYRSYLVYPRWDFDDATVDSKASSEDWLKFANIVNSVVILCVVFTYICLYGTQIPKHIIM